MSHLLSASMAICGWLAASPAILPTGAAAELEGPVGARHHGPQGVHWLHTSGRHIYDDQGHRWRPRGAPLVALQDCRDFAEPPDSLALAERADALCQQHHVNLFQLNAEPWLLAHDQSHPADTEDLVALVDSVGAHPNTYVLLTLASAHGDPHRVDQSLWQELVNLFAERPYVIFDASQGFAHGQADSTDQKVFEATTAIVHAVREGEARHHALPHLIAVQGATPGHPTLDHYTGHSWRGADAENLVWIGRRPNYVVADAEALFVEALRRSPGALLAHGAAHHAASAD